MAAAEDGKVAFMRILHDARDVLTAHWRERHGNIWAWMLPLAVLVCAIPPR